MKGVYRYLLDKPLALLYKIYMSQGPLCSTINIGNRDPPALAFASVNTLHVKVLL